jgi:hypothetical protein
MKKVESRISNLILDSKNINDKTLKKIANEHINQIAEDKKFIKLQSISLGAYFYKLKKEVGHGSFVDTIKKHYPNISHRTVQRYIASYKKEIKWH